MKKILLSSVAFLGLTVGAMAADLPSRRAPVPAIAAVPVFTWTGFYVGVNAGAGWNTNNKNIVQDPVTGTFFEVGGNNDAGFVGGGQVGYNYQIGSFVVGVEADLQWADLGRKNHAFVTPGFVAADRGGIDWFGTVRARAGFALDRALIYATGGFAYGAGDNKSTCLVGGIFVNCGNDDVNGGWTVGGGVEYAFTNNLTAKVEGLFVSIDRGNNNVFATGVFSNNKNLEFGVVRAGLNYKF